MKLKYTSYHFTILLILLLTLNAFNIAKAEYVMTITGGEVPAQEGITIEILINNAGDFTAFQVDIPIPEQFSYMEGSAVLNPDRIANHMLHAEIIDGNILRFICFSLTNAAFLGNTGSVASFGLIAGTQPGDYELTPLNPIIGVAGGGNVITEAIAGVVTLLAPDIQVNPESLNFGEIPLTSHHDMAVTVHNTGNQPLDISGISFDSPFFEVLEDDEFVLAPGNMQHLTIRFSSVEKGHYSQKMTIASNDPDEPELVVDLEAIAFAVNELHCGSMLSFSGTRDTLTLSINNMEEFVAFQFDLQLPEALTYVEGSASLVSNRIIDHIANANVIDGNILRIVAFSVKNEAFLGEDGDIISLAFDVFGTGGLYPLYLSNVIIADDEMNDILSAFYNGNLEVAAPDIHTAGSINFGDVSVLDTGEETLRIHNYGSDLLVIDQIQTNDASFFTNQGVPIEIPVGEYVDLVLSFNNAEQGFYEARLFIYSNDPDENPLAVALSANAFVPNYMIVESAQALQEDIVYIDILVENLESFIAFDFILHYPDDVLTFLPGSDFSQLSDRAVDHILAAGDLEPGMLRAFAYSMEQEAFLGNSGAVLSLGFEVSAPGVGISYPLILEDVILVGESGDNIIYEAINGELHIVASLVDYELPLTFNQGFTWFSVNVEPETGMGVNELFTGLAPCVNDRVISQTAFAFYSGTNWMGSLTQIDPVRRYVMNLCSAQGITLEGAPAENTPIAISPGFYWLGYTPQDCLPVNTALSSLASQVAVNDRIIGQTTFSFFDGASWIGSLTQMCPGVGYMLHVASPVTLTYPDATPGKGDAWLEADKVSPTGAYPQKNLQYTMPVLGKLIGYDKQVSVNEGDVIYAYVGEELRGMAYPMAAHDGFVFMSIGSDLPSGEEVHFKAWIAELGQLKLINETIRYEAFKGPGSMESPFLFTLGKVLDTPDMHTDGLFIGDPYPNPLTHQTHFPYVTDSPSELTLRVYDSYGRLVYEGVHTEDSPGRHSIAFERAGLPVGVYHYQLLMQAGSRSLEKSGRMVVME